MGDVAKAIGAARQLKQDTVGSNGQGYDPGLQQTPDMSPILQPTNVDMSGQGQSQAAPQPTDPLAMLGGSTSMLGVPNVTPPDQPAQAPTQVPIDNPYTPYDNNPTQDLSQNVGTNDSGVAPDSNSDVTVTGFKKTHEGFLPRLVDTLLELRGRQPVFQNRIDAADTERAMQGFTHDPMGTIQKIATINPDAAYRMWGEYTLNQARQAQADKSDAASNVLIDRALLPQVGGLAMKVANEQDPTKREALWEKARPLILSLGQRYKRDYSSMFPEKYDPDAISLAIGQAINPTQQTKLGQTDTRLAQQGERVEQEGQDTASRIQARSDRTRQGDEKIGMAQDKVASTTPRVIPTPHGNMVVKGNQGVITTPDGMAHLFMTNDGNHWVHVSTVPLKGVKH